MKKALGSDSKENNHHRQAVGGGDCVLVPLVRCLQVPGGEARLLALLQEQMVLCHLHLGGQTGCSILVSYQGLQHHHVDEEGTADASA